MSLSVFALIVAGVAVAVGRLVVRYRRELEAGRARLAAVERHVIATRWGQVEYAEEGSGPPVLVVHGIYQHCVSGLESLRGLLPGRRVIAPSRFGYLGSSLPPNASVADQADAFVALLDALGIDRIDVVAESAGTPSALQLALRHPDRVQRLAVLVGNFPGSPTAVVQPSWAKRIDRQLIMWVLKTIAPSTTARLTAAVPKKFSMSSEDARVTAGFIDSLFPMSPEGYNFDLYVSNADVNTYRLEAIRVPTLIVHTKDDQLASHEASKRAAERIPGARFISLESGGHLMLGQDKNLTELATFLVARGDHLTERVTA
jgi:pimeloyl-ACP methyl ester carboxylesterase